MGRVLCAPIMQPVPRVIIDAFAAAFAGIKPNAGFSAQEISDYFCGHSALVRPFEHYGMKPTRKELFVESVHSLTPETQYCALHQLAASAHPSKYAYPTRAARVICKLGCTPAWPSSLSDLRIRS